MDLEADHRLVLGEDVLAGGARHGDAILTPQQHALDRVYRAA